jgi:hypothetical protein
MRDFTQELVLQPDWPDLGASRFEATRHLEITRQELQRTENPYAWSGEDKGGMGGSWIGGQEPMALDTNLSGSTINQEQPARTEWKTERKQSILGQRQELVLELTGKEVTTKNW